MPCRREEREITRPRQLFIYNQSMGPLRRNFVHADGVNLYEMADYAAIQRKDGIEFLARIDKRLAERNCGSDGSTRGEVRKVSARYEEAS